MKRKKFVAWLGANGYLRSGKDDPKPAGEEKRELRQVIPTVVALLNLTGLRGKRWVRLYRRVMTAMPRPLPQDALYVFQEDLSKAVGIALGIDM